MLLATGAPGLILGTQTTSLKSLWNGPEVSTLTRGIVEFDRLGRRFHAVVAGNAPGGLSIRPLDRRVTYRSCRARDVIGHWSKRGRPTRATTDPLEPQVLQLEFDLTRRSE
jgi:hypothetical protein